jgi:flagellar motor switch protein FliN
MNNVWRWIRRRDKGIDMSDMQQREAHDIQFPEVEPATNGIPLMHLELEDLNKIELGLTADLGKAKMTVKDVLDLKVGSVVSLDKMAGEMTDVCLSELPIARGEVFVIGDILHVRLSEITGINEIQGF